MKKVLVIGASEYLGENLTLKLHESNYDVLAHVENSEDEMKFEKKGIKTINCEISSFESSNLIGIETVFYCKIEINPYIDPKEILFEQMFQKIGIIKECEKAKVKKFINASSAIVYLDEENNIDIKEDYEPKEGFISKKIKTLSLLDDITNNVEDTKDMATTNLRFGFIYGEKEPYFSEMLTNNKIKIIDNGNAIVDPTEINDAVNALICADKTNGPLSPNYNITSGTPMKLHNFIKQIYPMYNKSGKPLNMETISYRKAKFFGSLNKILNENVVNIFESQHEMTNVVMFGKNMTLNTELAKKELNYNPDTPLSIHLRNQNTVDVSFGI